MLELDFSIRDTGRVESVEGSPVNVSCSPKRTIDSCFGPTKTVEDDVISDTLATPDHIKRMRVEIEDSFNSESSEIDGFDLLASTDAMPVEDERPPTPQHLLDLRALINSEHKDVPSGPVDKVIEKPENVEDPFKHAGMLREYGGLKGFMEMLRNERKHLA